mgnify:CR=1 FL=1|tara:strand:+ start:7174 stop:7935 length:762 start_codon:yes stop_codon:yes gene_type:complete
MRANILIFLLFLAGGLSSALAQDVPVSPEGEEEVIALNFDFSVFPLDRADWSGIFYAPKGDPQDKVEELRFNPHERTFGFSYNGPTPFRIYRKSLSPEGEEIYTTVGEIELEPTREDLILFFSLDRGANSSGPYRIQDMVDSKETFPEDSIVFFNSTGATFFGLLGEERFTLKPGSSRPIDVSDFFENPAPIALVIKDGNNIRKVLVNKINFSPDRRTLMIIRPPASGTSLRVRTQRLTEFLGSQSPSGDSGA